MNVTVTVRRPVVKRCPHRDEIDAGELEITFTGDAPELHSLAAHVDAAAGEPVTHEEFTRQIAALVPGAHVTTRWSTGPWSVEVGETS